MNQDELLARLNGFEWSDFECKRAQRGVPEDAYKTVAAFANTAGGWLVFGVSERNGEFDISGVEVPDKVQNDFLSTLRTGQKLNRVVSVTPYRFEVGGRHVFAFEVPESRRAEKPIYLRGDPRQSYVRRGAGDEQCTQTELERFLRDASQSRYDAEALSEIPTHRFFDEATVKWYQTQFARRNPEHEEILDPIEFLLNWNFLVEIDGHVEPTRAGVLLFGQGRYVRHVLPRPVLDYQRIDTSFDQWSPEQRWHDRYVFEENIFQTWQGLVARYMRIAEHPFSLEPSTLRRNDDPPDYVAFREAAINLLIHQDYGDHGRKASIKLYSDRTIFWNPGDAFATEAQLLDPTEKEVRNPTIVKAFRRIGLSDQAGTGIRAIFGNWRELGRVPPRLKNDKAHKEFELVLINEARLTDAVNRFRRTIGVNLTPQQADVLALALSRTDGGRLSLTDIRGLGVRTTYEAKQIADYLINQQLLEPVGGTLFDVPEGIRQRFESQPPQVTPQVTPQVDELLSHVEEERTRQQLMEALGLKDRKHFTDAYLQPALDAGMIEMTIPDKPKSSRQRYRLTPEGRAALEQGGT
jgi:ATP-dependent DNA helicase RecG